MEWFTKSRQKNTNQDCDISVSINKDGKTCITFKNSSYLKITTTGHLIVGKENNKLYFGGSDRYEGFKLTTFNQAKTTCHVKITGLDFVIGDYNLEFDKDQALYYIDSDRRLK